MAATEAKILDAPSGGPARECRTLAVAEPARRVRVDLVAPRHARDLLAREQHDVERRGEQPDHALDPALQRELAGGAVCHGARL